MDYSPVVSVVSTQILFEPETPKRLLGRESSKRTRVPGDVVVKKKKQKTKTKARTSLIIILIWMTVVILLRQILSEQKNRLKG
jgi:preprotein translocase subunit Sec63